MTIAAAYSAFATAVATALVGAGYLAQTSALEVDPEDLVEPSGSETETLRAATLENAGTQPVRQILGRPEQRFVVERTCRVELLQYGPARQTRREVDAAAVAAMARIAVDLPTLSGACERLILDSSEETPVDPNGVAHAFTFRLRVRSGDPLGVTP